MNGELIMEALLDLVGLVLALGLPILLVTGLRKTARNEGWLHGSSSGHV